MTPGTRDTLLRAAEIIEKGGACKGTSFDGFTGRRCAIGAIDATYSLAIEPAKRELRLVIGRESIAEWNDSRPDASLTPEVAAMLRYTAEQERWECPEVSP